MRKGYNQTTDSFLEKSLLLDVVFSLLKCSKKIFVTLLGAVVFDPAPPPPTGLPLRRIDDYQKKNPARHTSERP